MSFELTPHQQSFLNFYSHQYENVVQQHAVLIEQSNRLIPIMNELRYNIQSIYTDARADSMRRQQVSTPTYASEYARPMMASSRMPMVQEVNVPIVAGITNCAFANVPSPINMQCPISLTRFEGTSEVAQINICGHVFIRTELYQWLQTNARCPLCRAHVDDSSNNVMQ